MTIVRLKKITLYGCLSEKQQILDELQNLGCLHITPLMQQKSLLDKKDEDSTLPTREAWRHLHNCPSKLKPIKSSSSFDPLVVEREILQNKRRLEECQAEIDLLKRQIDELTPWGSFLVPTPQEIADKKFLFYIIPHHEMKKVPWHNLCGEKVHKDNRSSYLVVIAENEPAFMPGKRVELPMVPLKDLKERLEQKEVELENLQIERIKLTRWRDLFEKNLSNLEDFAGLDHASHQTYDERPIFALQGWIPAAEVEKVRSYATEKGVAITIEEPSPEESPPTLLENQAPLKGGEDLVSFYMTPSYWLWDPSTTIFFSFAIFFAMIFSDAGYSIILGAIVAFFWKRLGSTITGKRFRNVLVALTLFSLIWGILVGSYFGINPSSESFLSNLKILDMSNYAAMMLLAVLVGVIHIVIANLAQAWSKRKSQTAIANIGWAITLIGAVVAAIGLEYPERVSLAKTVGIAMIGLGMVAIVLFTTIERPLWKRLIKGLLGLTRITGMFGDVLSYLRLFALGLASASLAAVFNDLAIHVYHAMPGFKILFALLILVVGHGINFSLSLMSGFIHGLRLNFIEFFNWSLPEEGAPFKVFSKKEMSKWTR